MTRYKLIVQYDGTKYNGWQLQNNFRTIQGVIEKAILNINKSAKRIPLHGSGRTDTGVHAFGQVAHFDLETVWNTSDMLNALNGNLPNDCRILKVNIVDRGFESRYNAKKRWYFYQCYLGDSLLYANQSWAIRGFDIKILNKLSSFILGTHNFLSFSKFNKSIQNTNSIIYYSKWNLDSQMLNYDICGNRFLHHMVRYLVGTMIAVAKNNYEIDDFKKLINKPSKIVKILKAPACGLFLKKVEYE